MSDTIRHRALRVCAVVAAVGALHGCREMPSERRIGEAPAVEDNEDLDEFAVLQQPITGGQTDARHPSVGILKSGSGLCTATLIGERVVLTAAHCVASRVVFELAGRNYSSQQIIVHPNYGSRTLDDLAIVTLAEAPSGVAPSPINTAPLRVGQSLTLVGYGSPGFGIKRYGTNTIDSVGSTTFTFTGNSNVCEGDSGGPTFVVVDGEQRQAGIHTQRIGPCGYGGRDMRVDAYAQWIEQTAQGSLAGPGDGSPPSQEPTGPAGEGESCGSRECATGLVCATVFSGGRQVGQFCMEQCTHPGGTDAVCDGGERCTDSRTVGPVCFNANNPSQGFTNPQSGDSPPAQQPPAQEPAADCHQGSVFELRYCSVDCPCDAGQGDCDSDSECRSGLSCARNVGDRYGVNSGIDVCEEVDGGSTPPPATEPPPGSESPPQTTAAKEGESCEHIGCDTGLACATVYTAGYGKVIGQYCMERCQTLGRDPVCDGGESCVASRTAGDVCFNPNNPGQGYTDPEDGSSTPTTPPPSDPPPAGDGECGFNGNEAQLFALLNQERAANGAGPVDCNTIAADVARAHSQDMCDRGFFDHINPDGQAPWDRMRAAGLSFTAAGENIAAGQRSAQAVNDAWMNSPGHRDNMLNPGWTHTGVGQVNCAGSNYWTEVFHR